MEYSVEERLDECLSREFEDSNAALLLTFAKVAVDDSVKAKAVDFARTKIGTEYNDIFSETCKSSTGKEAYYCCQLVRKAYRKVSNKHSSKEHSYREGQN